MSIAEASTTERPGPVARLDQLLARPVRMRPLEQLRIAIGLIALAHLQPFLLDALRGRTYHDVFHHHYVGWYPDLPPAMYTALLVVGAAASLAMAAGLFTRVATAVTFGVVAYNLFASTTHFHNNRAYLVTVLGVLAFAPLGHQLAADAVIRRRRGESASSTVGPGWPVWLVRFVCATVYGASAVSKLVDPDWFGGTVTWMRVVADEASLRGPLVPGWYADVVLDRTSHVVIAKLIIGTELFISLGLWFRRTRPFAVAIAIVFHIAIQFTADVEIFSYLAIAVLLVWQDVDPDGGSVAGPGVFSRRPRRRSPVE